jgi:hypothetical protein
MNSKSKTEDTIDIALTSKKYSGLVAFEPGVSIIYTLDKAKIKYYLVGSEVQHKFLILSFDNGITALRIEVQIYPEDIELFDWYSFSDKVQYPEKMLDNKYFVSVQKTEWSPNYTIGESNEISGIFNLKNYIYLVSAKCLPCYQGMTSNCADWAYKFVERLGGEPLRSNERKDMIYTLL